ncbi:MAG: FtsX-like permease family protein, partial [Promethearchaeota archaeon]
MGNRLSFYFSQGTKNLKKSVLIIFGLSLAISMVSGISLYIDSYQKYFVNQSFDQILDFNVIYHPLVESENISDFLPENDQSIISTIQNSKNLEIESYFRYFYLYTSDFCFYRNYSALNGHSFNNYDIVEGNFVNLGLFDANYYTSKRFQSYFSIINGTYPKSNNEIMIPIDLAYKMNLTLGEVSNLDIKYAWDEKTLNLNVSLSNVKIIGIYAAKNEHYRYAYAWLSNNYNYYEENNTVTGYKELNSYSSEFVFSYYNFTKRDNNHPVQNLLDKFNYIMNSNNSESSELIQYSYIEKNSGLGFCYNRDLIDFNHLNSFSRRISQETQILQRQIDSYQYGFQDYLSSTLKEIYLISNIFRIVLQILNIPVLIFAIFIGSFAIKTNAKSRLDEFLLLRSKGSPNSLLRNQFFIEALFNGIASSTIALFAGFGTFYGFRGLLNQMILSTDSNAILTPSISWGTVILTFIIGISITFLASFSSIAYVSKLPTYQLLGILESDSMDVEYDEKSLFSLTEGKKISVEETPFFKNSKNQNADISSDNIENTEKEGSKKGIKKLFFKNKKHSLYQNSIKVKEKKNPKLSIAFIIISLFPLIIYLLYLLGTIPTASDILISISAIILNYFWIIMILAIISPILFVVGIIRILIVEKPSRFAQISKFLTNIFLKDRSYICGIEMVKRKQYKTVIFLVGIFTSLLVFSNVFLNSLSRYDLIIDNIKIGSDVKASIKIDTMNITNTQDIELLESQLKSYKTPQNETLINDVLTYYGETSEPYSGSRYYIDLEKYLNFIQEDNKKLPSGNFLKKIKDLINYNKDHINSTPGVIVNEGFLTLYNLKIGDTFMVNHSFYNSTS